MSRRPAPLFTTVALAVVALLLAAQPARAQRSGYGGGYYGYGRGFYGFSRGYSGYGRGYYGYRRGF
jgi:hypothetical protein